MSLFVDALPKCVVWNSVVQRESERKFPTFSWKWWCGRFWDVHLIIPPCQRYERAAEKSKTPKPKPTKREVGSRRVPSLQNEDIT